jgi:Ni/Fe-hydrogenase subunit HybB-like protein
MLVLWIELVPPALERSGMMRLRKAYYKSLYVIIPLGIVLPTMHQSGLGAVIVAAGSNVSPLWQTPWIGFLFLTSAIIMGFAIVVFEGALTVMGLGRRLELHLYRKLARILRWVIVFYLLVRFADLVQRDALGAIFETPARTAMFTIENLLFALPLIILLHPRWRGNARLLFVSAMSLLLAGAVLRFNALIVGFNPSAGYTYFPSWIELLVSIGLLAVEYIVKRYPILPPRKRTVAPGSEPAPGAGAVGA